MSGTQASNSPAPPKAAAVVGPGGTQAAQPMKRHLSFSLMKPPFVPHDDYHRFSSSEDTHRIAAHQEAEAIVVKSPTNIVVAFGNQYGQRQISMFGFNRRYILSFS
ncbi:E2F transcription factor 3 [Sarracenia purpurea var. burkii]